MANRWKNSSLALNPNFVDVSSGSDGTGANQNPELPYLTAQASYNNFNAVDMVFGVGTYTGVFNITQGGYFGGEEGLGKYTIINLNGGTATLYRTLVKNLTFKNGTVLLRGDFTIEDCVFIDMAVEGFDALTPKTFNNCEFINTDAFQNVRAYDVRLSGCKFINSTVYNAKNISAGYGVTVLESCDVDQFSNIQFRNEASIIEINYNNIRGNLMFQDGTNPDVYIDLATALIDYPAVMGVNNINTNPLYNDDSKLALTVPPISPNVGTGKFGNIGNVKIANAYFCDISPEMTGAGGGGSAVFTNFDGTTDKTVNAGFATASFTTGTLVVDSSIVREVGVVDYVGKLALDSALGGLANSQVPTSLDSADGTIGNKPEVLAYEGRFMDAGSTPPNPNVNAEWNNGGYKPAGTWTLFAWGQQPMMDSLFRGNGDPNYDDNDPAKFIVGAKWFQIRGQLVKDTWNDI